MGTKSEHTVSHEDLVTLVAASVNLGVFMDKDEPRATHANTIADAIIEKLGIDLDVFNDEVGGECYTLEFIPTQPKEES